MRASLRRPRSRSLSSSSSSSFFPTSATAPYSLFALHHRRCSTVFRYRYRVLLRGLTFSEFRSIKPRGRSSGDLSKAREKPDVLSQGKERTLLHKLFQTFLSFPHCLVAPFTQANASSKPQYRRLEQQRTHRNRYIVGTKTSRHETSRCILEIYLEDSDKYSSVTVYESISSYLFRS